MKRNKPVSENGQSIEGVLVIDKPEGISSYHVIRRVKEILSARKIGHTGTLDPLASGVLPVVINATKIIPFLDEGIKVYEGTLRLGVVTDSDDSTGRVTAETLLDELALNEDRIRSIFSRYVGKIKQIPPMFSAVKYRGKPLYSLARKGIEVERRERETEIFSLEVTAVDLPLVDFRVSCSRGTYVRVLCRQMGEAMGTGAHLCRLRRTRSGPFILEQSLTIDEFVQLAEEGRVGTRIISPRQALGSMTEIEVGREMGIRIRAGQKVSLEDMNRMEIPFPERNQRIKILEQGKVVAIAQGEVPKGNSKDPVVGKPALSLLRVFT